jgi:hypothetical protein
MSFSAWTKVPETLKQAMTLTNWMLDSHTSPPLSPSSWEYHTGGDKTVHDPGTSP